jgi:iron(III) transport system substrate-binding protein
MNIRLNGIRFWVVLMALSVLGPDQSFGQSPSAARRKEEASRKGMVYLTREEILQEAKKEGKVVLYPGYDENTIPLLVDIFKKKYPFIKEVTWGSVTGIAAAERELLEMAAGRAAKDAFAPHPPFWSDYFKQNLIKRYDFKAMSQDGQINVPQDMIDGTGSVIWTGVNLGVLVYNSKLVAADKAPKSWESCLDPQWKGKITVDTKPNILAWLAPRWGEEKLLDYAAKLKANDPVWSRGHTGVIPRLVNGEFLIMCGTYVHTTQRLLKSEPEMPIKMVVPNPLSVGFQEPVAIYAHAKSPYAGLLWAEFLASKEAQALVDSGEPGKGSFLVEGTLAFQLAKGASASICASGCIEREQELVTRIAVEAWKLPKVGYQPK